MFTKILPNTHLIESPQQLHAQVEHLDRLKHVEEELGFERKHDERAQRGNANIGPRVHGRTENDMPIRQAKKTNREYITSG